MTVVSRLVARRMRLPRERTAEPTVERDLRITMDDGVVLLADRYAPPDAPAAPVILVRSPYGRRGLYGLMTGRLFAERGFQVVVQSCRGGFGSAGAFVPQANEQADGAATLAWIRKQPWCGGRVATAGPSYLGYTQWALADGTADLPDAMALMITMPHFAEPTFDGGSFALDSVLRWTRLVSTHERRGALARQAFEVLRGDDPPRLRRGYDTLPLAAADTAAIGRRVEFFQDWLAHRPSEPYWTRQDHRAAVARVGAAGTPVVMVTGWYDIFLPWQLRDHAELASHGTTPRLVVGPWSHVSPQLQGASVRESLAFLREHLVDGAPARPAEPPVRFFVTGGGGWRTSGSWPPPGLDTMTLHLQPGGGLAVGEPPEGAPDQFRYDPADPTPAVSGPTLTMRAGPVDNRALESRLDVLTYTTEPLAAPREVIGEARVELYVGADVPYVDVFARVCDVHPDGTSTNVCDRLVRLTADDGPAPDGTRLARLTLWPTAHRFGARHRIRLQVSGGAHPRYARNTGTGEPLATATRLVAVRQEIHHDPAHPSRVLLPVTDAG